MKTINFRFKIWTVVVALFTAILFVACDDNDNGKIPEEPGTDPVEVVMQNVALTGTVYDTNNNPLSGVRVTTGTLASTTGNDGKFTFTQANIVSSRAVIKFEKQGYFTVTRSGIKENEMALKVVLRAKGSNNTSSTTFNADQAKTLSTGEMQATVPANGLVRADGSTYTGTVNADMLYLDPNDADFNTAMPGGDLAAIRTDNSEVQLISYGMTEISLTDNTGKPLQLREGETSTLTFPIPAGMESDPPVSIPLWYFDDEKGIWIEEGVATLQGNVYVGTINHFSWHNLDVPVDRVTIKGKVTDCDGKPIQYVKVTARQIIGFNGYNQGIGITGSTGDYIIYAPANTELQLTVLSEDYHNYTDPWIENIPRTSGNQTLTKNISLPCITVTPPVDPGEGGTTTNVDKLNISFIVQGGATMRIAFDNGGKRFRYEGDDGGEPLVMIVDSIAKKFYLLESGEWIDFFSSEIAVIMGITWDNPGVFVEMTNMPKEFLETIFLDPTQQADGWDVSKTTNQTIAGKNCDVYAGSGFDPETKQKATVKIAKWNGITMLLEVDGEVYYMVQSVSFEVSESEFKPN